MVTPINGEVSYWFAESGLPEAADSLDGDADADVVIVGAGFTGLWTAYYLAERAPALTVRIIEERFAGFGASGRNGGWLTNTITGGADGYASRYGRPAAAALQSALNDTVDEVMAVAQTHGIDAGIRKGGSLMVARSPAQLARRDAELRHAETWPEEGFVGLSADETQSRVRIAGALGGMWQPHSARIDPARLVRGLADVVRGRGVRIHEGTRATRISPGVVETERGRLRAHHVVRATEGFTARLPGLHRRWVPLNSSLIITETLPSSAWEEIGWAASETVEDFAHVYSYLQRTPDGRIALGGRGTPYRYGSRTDSDGRSRPATIEALTRILHEWFPVARTAAVAHAWSGVLGVPRDWRASVGFDPKSGLASAGGYVGTGVASSHLAGRTLADLLTSTDTARTHLPWVNHSARDWEPEPLRWLAITSIYRAYGWADSRETRRGTSRQSRLATLADLISGR